MMLSTEHISRFLGLFLTLFPLASGPAHLWAVEDGFRIELGYRGEYVDGEGTGYGNEKWHYYDREGWWSQWFYNAPYDPERKKVIETQLTVSLRDRKLPGRVEIAYNWSTGAWSELNTGNPPLPGVVTDPAGDKKYIACLPFAAQEMPAGYVPRGPLTHGLKIPQYNPEWVSIDVRGENVLVEGWIKHECLPKGPETQACCLRNGDCLDLPPEDCDETVPIELIDTVTGEGTGIFVLVPGEPQGANTDCSTVDCPKPFIEIDGFESPGRIELITPLGAEVVELNGHTELRVYFEGLEEGAAHDDDGDEQEEVVTELVEMDLVGSSSMLGEVRVRLRSDAPSLGQIEEQANVTSGVLDVEPFTSGGTADSFFDVFFEIELPDREQTLRARRPKRLTAVLSQKPPAPCDRYEDHRPVELVDTSGSPTGYILGRVSLGLQCQACCFPDGPCQDLPPTRCRESGGAPQGPDTDCATARCGGSTDCNWQPGMPHKMHWPQEPDLSPTGVDVSAALTALADDFKCTGTGPITDIHIWGSFADDVVPQNGPGSLPLTLSIYEDDSAPDGGLLGNIFYAASTLDGTAFGRDVMVDAVVTDTSHQVNPALAVDRWGIIHVAWEDYRDNAMLGNIYYSKSKDGGESFGRASEWT